MSTRGSKTDGGVDEDTDDEWGWICPDDVSCTRPETLTFMLADASAIFWEEDTNSTVFCVHGHAFKVPAGHGRNNFQDCQYQWYHARFSSDVGATSSAFEIHQDDRGICVHLVSPTMLIGEESEGGD